VQIGYGLADNAAADSSEAVQLHVPSCRHGTNPLSLDRHNRIQRSGFAASRCKTPPPLRGRTLGVDPARRRPLWLGCGMTAPPRLQNSRFIIASASRRGCDFNFVKHAFLESADCLRRMSSRSARKVTPPPHARRHSQTSRKTQPRANLRTRCKNNINLLRNAKPFGKNFLAFLSRFDPLSTSGTR